MGIAIRGARKRAVLDTKETRSSPGARAEPFVTALLALPLVSHPRSQGILAELLDFFDSDSPT